MIENKKEKIDIEKLGNEKLDLKIDYPDVQTNENTAMLDGTIENFLTKICRTAYNENYEINILEIEALNKNKNKIKSILDYVVNLDDNKLAYKNRLIYNFPRYLFWTNKERETLNTLEFKKVYMILQLIQWGVNPFEIRRCLESKGNDNFNWKKFIEYVMDNRNILKKIYDGRCIRCERFYEAMNIIRVMYLFESLFNTQSNNLKPFEVDFLLQDCSELLCYGGIYVITQYLNELDDNQQNNEIKKYLLEIPDGYLYKNFFDLYSYDVDKSDGGQNEINNDPQNNKNKEDLQKILKSQINYAGLMVDFYAFDFNKKDFENDQDFWTLISHLNNDPVLISFFALVAMRKISFTESQMNFIAQKINNQQVINNLRKINQSLDYKIKSINQYGLARRVKLGSVTAILDYAFLKMSRCIGYLGAALFDIVLCIPALIIGGGFAFGAVYGICLTASALWTTTFWIVLSILSVGAALLLIWCFNTIFNSYLKEIFAKFANGMERFYDNGKIVNWLELYNIKHPINQIGDPPLNLETGDIPPARTEPYQADSKLTVPNMVGLEIKDQNQN